MNDTPAEEESRYQQSLLSDSERMVVVVPEHILRRVSSQEIGIGELLTVLWRGKWIIVGVTVMFAIASVLYALAQPHWYRAETLLAPSDGRSASPIGGQLGGLAALAGVSVNTGSSAEALATLQSRDFAREFIQDLDLLPVFFSEQWDQARAEWRDSDSGKWPDIRDAVQFFGDNVLDVVEDRQTQLVKLAVEWKDPAEAASWAGLLVQRLNAKLRERALEEAESNIAFLQSQLAETNLVTLQQSIGRLLENELQKMMLARGNEEFAFRVIDAAKPPKYPSRPRRALIAVLGTMLGGFLGVSIAFILHVTKIGRQDGARHQLVATPEHRASKASSP